MTNLFKSVFVVALPAIVMTLAAYSLLNTGTLGVPTGILLALANGVVAGFFMMLLALKDRARTKPRLHGIAAVVGLFGVSGALLASSVTATVVAIAATPMIGWFVYDFWYSSFGTRSSPDLEVGKRLPLFLLEDQDGESVSSESFLGSPALLLFYRGNWCPLCMAQIKEIARDYRALAERGVQVLLISPQPHRHTRALASAHNVPFRFLVDTNNTVARRLGLDVKFGVPMGMQVLGYASETVMPTVVISDAEGTILFADLTDNYRVRPEPETFFRVLDGAGQGSHLEGAGASGPRGAVD
jgi:peroxiredoxin